MSADKGVRRVKARASARTTADSYGMTTNRGYGNGNGKQKQRQRQSKGKCNGKPQRARRKNAEDSEEDAEEERGGC